MFTKLFVMYDFSDSCYGNSFSNITNPHNGYNPYAYFPLPSSQLPFSAYTANMYEQYWSQAQQEKQWHLPTVMSPSQQITSEHDPFRQQGVKRSPGNVSSDEISTKSPP